jgi:hypothetical protein
MFPSLVASITCAGKQPTSRHRHFATAPASTPVPPHAVATRYLIVAAVASPPLPPHAVTSRRSTFVVPASPPRAPTPRHRYSGFSSAPPRLGLRCALAISCRPGAQLCTVPAVADGNHHSPLPMPPPSPYRYPASPTPTTDHALR